jgi:MFS family permease
MGMAFAVPLWWFLSRMPEQLRMDRPSQNPATFAGFVSLFRIPMLRWITLFVTFATFSIFLVYTWLPTFLYDKFKIGLAHAAFEASTYPQIGTALGLLVGGVLADRLSKRSPAGRFYVVITGFVLTSPCIFFIGAATALETTRMAATAFGFAFGFITANQVACAYEVVPPRLRASTVGLLNLVGAGMSGFAPYLGGLSRRTIGVDRLMTFAAALLLVAALTTAYALWRHFERDRMLANTDSH